MKGKTVSFQIYNTTAVAYLLNEGGTHYKTLNGLVRKILLRFHENGVMVYPEYLWANALLRVKKAEEQSLGDPDSHGLFK